MPRRWWPLTMPKRGEELRIEGFELRFGDRRLSSLGDRKAEIVFDDFLRRFFYLWCGRRETVQFTVA
ncbi:uncharacterized protein A4U43_C04F8390 [Asparagus officinalis]|uniref:Uncharacterized protein n=1 Tax=Asparagus officinalis TaxID=4686 RepID=A0A5P1EZP7_ASPOF|nr:uncharacterized protein A4U43_C04F8390 [Asparagus officinalis]